MLADLIHKIAGMNQADEELPYYPRSSLAGPMHREGIDTRCLRQMVYWAAGFPKNEMPGRSFIVFDDGNWHAELTKDWLKKSIYKIHSEEMSIEVDGRKGHIDCLITDPMGKDYLIELKSINHFSFERIWKGEIPWDYVSQCCDYMNGLQKVNPEIQEGLILFKNKNNGVYLELWLSYYAPIDQCTIEKMIRSTGEEIKIGKVVEWPVVGESNAKFQAVADHVKNKTLPKRPYFMDHWRCDYCRWNETCWKSFDEEFAALSDTAQLEGEIVDLCKYYLETNLHLSEMDKEKEKLRTQIINILEAKESKKGVAGSYNISWQLRQKKGLDQSLIPIDILQKAEKDIKYFVLNIRQRKEKP